MRQLPSRLRSIDVLRAVTMFFMIFVNDLDPVQNVPEWIKHAKADKDALGFADTIFPAFLFIVGLSLPFAISNRIRKGDTRSRVFIYVLLRSLALLVMGFFHVNLENYNSAAVLPKAVWEIIITIAFFLIWLDYPAKMKRSARLLLQGLGIALLLLMAILYKGGEDEPTGMRTYWWGILGLIGWAYLISSIVYLVSKEKIYILVAAALFFFLFNLAVHAGWITDLGGIRNYVWIAGSGSMPAFTMFGVVVSALYRRFSEKERYADIWKVLIPGGMVLIGLCFIVRPYGGISKIHDTPAWVAVCTGISMLVFALMIWLIDRRNKQQWFSVIMPAGTSTLTCYLIPYLLYSVYEIIHFHYPYFLNQGPGGLLRSFLISFVVVFIAGWLERRHLRLSI